MRVLAIIGEDPWRGSTGTLLRIQLTLAGLLAADPVDEVDVLEVLPRHFAADAAPVPSPFRLLDRVTRPSGGTGVGLALAGWSHLRPRDLYAKGQGEVRARLAAAITAKPPYDLVWVVREWLLDAAAPVLAAHAPGVPVICDVDDLDEAIHRTRAQETDLGSTATIAARLDGAMVRFVRARSVRSADLLLAASPADVPALGPGGRLLPNTFPPGADDVPPPPAEGPPTVLFAGSMQYWPNRLGAEFLTDQVWPRVRAALPDARLHLVGPTREDADLGEQPDGITVTGRVPEMAPWLAGAHVVAAPVFGGAGTAIKVLEGFAARRPVVGTPFAFRGLPEPGRLGHVAADASTFADALVGQLTAPDTDRVAAAHAFVTAHHTPAVLRNRVGELVAEVTDP